MLEQDLGRDLERLLAVSRAYHPIPLGDQLLLASDAGGHPLPYRLDAPGAEPERLLGGEDRVLPVGVGGPDLIVARDRGGNETWQLEALHLETGELRRLTSDERAIHRSVAIAPEGRRAGLAYNPGGQDDFRLGVLDLAAGAITDWSAEPGSWVWLAWSPYGERAVVARGLSGTRNLAYLLDPDGKLIPLLAAARRVAHVEWIEDRILAITDFESDYLGLVEVDPARPGEPARWLLREEADVVTAVASAGGRLAAALNRGAYDELLILDASSGSRAAVTGLGPGLLHSDNVSDASQQLAWAEDGSLFVAWESPTRPTEVYRVPPSEPPERWTSAGDAPEGLTVPAETSYRTFDGRRVPALHYRVDGRPRPTLVWFHGGPESQLRGSFSPVFHALNRAGFDVFAPNVRGSTGYGVEYFSLDDRELRWDSVRDGSEAGRHLKREGYATRLAVMGGSYGGFLTLAVLVDDPDLWDAGVDIVGIADWHTFFKHTSGWRRAVRAGEYGDPETADGEFLAEFSPLRRAHTIRAPLLVIHGRNDVRVPLEEAEQIAAAAEAELLVFEDEGHGLARHANRVRGYGRAIEFLLERLGEP